MEAMLSVDTLLSAATWQNERDAVSSKWELILEQGIGNSRDDIEVVHDMGLTQATWSRASLDCPP